MDNGSSQFRAQRRHNDDSEEWGPRFDEFNSTWPPDRPLSDFRSPWRRDGARLKYSHAFLRLADVTQILHAGPSTGSLHNRLTHTLKVEDVARSIGEAFNDPAIDPDVCGAAALAHDLGHPPFGHVGEHELNRLLVERGSVGYEGNAQTFRIVTRLATHHPIEPGLDLTRATLRAILKYALVRDDHEALGVYPTEREDFEFATSSLREWTIPSAEATIADWSDDFSYALHDLDDFYRTGYLSINGLLDSDLDGLFETARGRERSPYRSPLEIGLWAQGFDELKTILTHPENRPLRRSFNGEQIQKGLLAIFTSQLITRWINSLTKSDQGFVTIEPICWHQIALLREYVYQAVVQRPDVAGSQVADRRKIELLFERTLSRLSTSSWSKIDPPLRFMLSVALVEAETGSADVSENATMARAVADYISQMTETEANARAEQMRRE